ncbi:hypothetical protein RvY_08980 [Ramazzottius varieornatus]|uniref:DDE Tnp4 domain-containing protein n=1 Tax=Ramazzottius varieornatus TaxID=947166 RepID=A0A1D1V7W1_RAMVA|nr:hypothetical protein RvY_08980 [Ramazzottius varieornatus]
MSRESFETVLRKIEGHDAFHRPSNNHQSDPRLQLLICAYRFGSSGGSSSVGKTARRFGVSEGFVILCTGRCIEGLLSSEGSEVTWPNKKERASIKARILGDSGFPDCVGMLDGTLIPLEHKPAKDGEDYWSHKSRYGISAMVVCDDKRKIRYLCVGF